MEAPLGLVLLFLAASTPTEALTRCAWDQGRSDADRLACFEELCRAGEEDPACRHALWGVTTAAQEVSGVVVKLAERQPQLGPTLLRMTSRRLPGHSELAEVVCTRAPEAPACLDVERRLRNRRLAWASGLAAAAGVGAGSVAVAVGVGAAATLAHAAVPGLPLVLAGGLLGACAGLFLGALGGLGLAAAFVRWLHTCARDVSPVGPGGGASRGPEGEYVGMGAALAMVVGVPVVFAAGAIVGLGAGALGGLALSAATLPLGVEAAWLAYAVLGLGLAVGTSGLALAAASAAVTALE